MKILKSPFLNSNILHFITGAIRMFNANIPLTLSAELLNVKESLFGQFSIEFVEAGLFFLDVLSILIDKGIISEFNNNQLIQETLEKFLQATDICSTTIKRILKNYISRYCNYICNWVAFSASWILILINDTDSFITLYKLKSLCVASID